jgi:hypothetical protein
VNKLKGTYREDFYNQILNNLLSKVAFEIAAGITDNPNSIPSKGFKDRDTTALSLPVNLFNDYRGEEPFIYEKSKRGNQYKPGTIPSYSYSCVNFRNIFYEIVSQLVKEREMLPLFRTFMDIVLENYTITTYTGYTFKNCPKNAFKFNEFLDVRDSCTKSLEEYGFVQNENEWKPFQFSLKKYKLEYHKSKAIATLVYKKLIESLDLKDFSSDKKIQNQDLKMNLVNISKKMKLDE